MKKLYCSKTVKLPINAIEDILGKKLKIKNLFMHLHPILLTL